MTRFACVHCGSGMIAEHRGSSVSVRSVQNALQRVQINTGKIAAELAIVRLRQEISEIDQEIQQAETESEIISRGFLLSLGLVAILGFGVTSEGAWMGAFLWIPASAIGIICYSGNRSMRRKARRHAEQARVERDSPQLKLKSARQIDGA